MEQTKEDIGAYMSWIPLVGGSLSVVVGGLIADYVVRKYGPLARLFVIVVSLVRLSDIFYVRTPNQRRFLVTTFLHIALK